MRRVCRRKGDRSKLNFEVRPGWKSRPLEDPIDVRVIDIQFLSGLLLIIGTDELLEARIVADRIEIGFEI